MIYLASLASLALGFVLARAIQPPRPVVVIRREPMPWMQRGDVRERIEWSSEQVAALLDRCSAKDQRIAELQGLLSDRRLAEAHDARELRLVK